VGAVFGLNAIGFTNIDIFFDGWWTLFIIIPCGVGLFTEKEKTGNIIGLVIGLIILGACQGLYDLSIVFKLIVPLAVILIGVKMIFGSLFSNKTNAKIKELRQNGQPLKEYCATFSGQKIDYSGQLFEGAEMTAVFGGIDCDLRNATFMLDTVINATTVFGGIDIFIPDNVNVKVVSNSIFGGISDKKRNSDNNTVTLYINATCVFGGVDIK